MLAGEALLFAGVFFAVHTWQTRGLMAPGDEAMAPATALPDLAGQLRTLEEFRGRPTLVYFFAPWCGVCAASADNLSRLSRWREDRVNVVLVALDYEAPGDVADYARRHELDMPVLLGEPATGRQWRIPGYPTYYVLDSGGRIRQRDFGYSTTLGLVWRTWRSE